MSIDPTESSPRSATGSRTASVEDRGSTQSGKPVDWWQQGRSSPPAETSAKDAGQLPQAATELVDKAKETARAAAKAVSSQAADLAANIGSELTETAEEQKGRGADAMRGFAKAVQGAANDLDGQSPTVARYIRSAAVSFEGLSDTIRSRSVKDLVTTASDAARTNPAAFFIGAVAAGFALSRFFKSTSRPSAPDVGTGGSADGAQSAMRRLADEASEGVMGFGGRT